MGSQAQANFVILLRTRRRSTLWSTTHEVEYDHSEGKSHRTLSTSPLTPINIVLVLADLSPRTLNRRAALTCTGVWGCVQRAIQCSSRKYVIMWSAIHCAL